jgi:hypothetical protein
VLLDYAYGRLREGAIPDRTGSDDLLGQCADIRKNWQSGESRPDAHNIELEVTYDAHEEHSAGIGGGNCRRC